MRIKMKGSFKGGTGAGCVAVALALIAGGLAKPALLVLIGLVG